MRRKYNTGWQQHELAAVKQLRAALLVQFETARNDCARGAMCMCTNDLSRVDSSLGQNSQTHMLIDHLLVCDLAVVHPRVLLIGDAKGKSPANRAQSRLLLRSRSSGGNCPLTTR